MFGIKNKKFDWDENNVPKLKDLDFSLEFSLRTKEKKETSYPDTNTLINVSIKENLLADSDSKRKEILKEVESKLEELYSKIEVIVLNSDKLSDEYYKNKQQL